MMRRLALGLGGAIALLASTAPAQQVGLAGRPIVDAARGLKPGEYIWSPGSAPEGPGLVLVNLDTQRLVVFRNGLPIGASTVSTGAKGHETPTGVFTILQKAKEHYSKTYGNAPMPNMQRLTWKGIALHAGKLPGYPASHGCIRLPHEFSALLFGATHLGMTVVITSVPAVPQMSGSPAMLTASLPTDSQSLRNAAYEWHPERSTDGIVSVVVSAADQRAIVMRGGVEIGSGPVRVGGRLDSAVAYVLRAWDEKGKSWLKLQVSGPGSSMAVDASELNRFDTPVQFRQAVAAAVRPGSVIIVTPESLKAGSPGRKLDVIKEDGSAG